MIKCVAIDDEPIALSIIEEYCHRRGDIEIRCFSSPVAGMEFIETNGPDIVFLDIEMNSHNGVELARQLPAGTCLIFTTAYAEYALDGFEVNAVDFLHKPIFYPRFLKALEKAELLLGARAKTLRREAISLRVEHKNVFVDLADITHVEAMDNYVKVYRFEKPMVVTQITMKEMEAMLPAERFLRVHRSFIVGLDYIEQFSNRLICSRGVKSPIPVGRKYLPDFNKFYNTLKQNK